MSISVDENVSERWREIRRFTDRPSSFATPAFEPGTDNMNSVHSCRVLVIGAGGLGCEILKDLALSGFKNIEVIDMDTIDLSNLNRQFLFREADIGKSKAKTSAKFVMERVEGCNVVPHMCRIQDKSMDFYRSFHIVICGLDSIDARRWLNAMICDLVTFDEDGQADSLTIVPLIDGGTEGFKGNARVIFPFLTPCVECTIDLYPPQVNYPMCTIAHTPRLPEHCVEYVKVVLWKDENPFNTDLDADNMLHAQWVCTKAMERAKTYGIQGVNLSLTLGVLKRIIPAVASTNAIIAGSCVLEALKLASNISWPMNNYLNFSDAEGVHFGVVKLEKNANCIACSRSAITVEVSLNTSLETFLELIKSRFVLKNPSLSSSDGVLYMISMLMPEATKVSRENLQKKLADLNICDDGELVIADETLRQSLSIRVKFKSDSETI